MGEALNVGEVASARIYEAPEQIGQVVLAAEARGTSGAGTADSDSQWYWYEGSRDEITAA